MTIKCNRLRDNSDCFNQYSLKDSSSGLLSGHPSLMNCKTLERIGSAFVHELICPAVTGLLDIFSINKINSGGNGVDPLEAICSTHLHSHDLEMLYTLAYTHNLQA